MPELVTCYACEREPSRQCPRCGRPYCEEHGEDVCGVCLQPSSGVPSFTLYRGSLLALLVATALAVWLLVQPTGGGETAIRPVVVTTTPTLAAFVTQAPATQVAGSPVVTGTPGTPPAGATGTRTVTPATGTPAAGGTVTAAGEYTVAGGDSLSAICEKIQRPAGMIVPDCVDQIVKLNSLPSANDISVGQKLKVPR